MSDCSEVAPAIYPVALFEARTRAEWRKIPAPEILASYLQGPILVFDPAAFAASDRQAWHPAVRSDQLQALRAVYGAAKNEAHRLRLEREAVQLWRELVERAIGYRWPGGELIAWQWARFEFTPSQCVMCCNSDGRRSRYFGVTVCQGCERGLYIAQIVLRDHDEKKLLRTLYPEDVDQCRVTSETIS